MFLVDDQQIKICLLKSDLEEIENGLVAQRSAIPELEGEFKEKHNETITLLQEHRSLNLNIEKLINEEVALLAKREQLKQQRDDDQKTTVTYITRNINDMVNFLKQEEAEILFIIRQYEDCLREKADRFARTHGYYDKAQINRELDNINNTNAESEVELGRKQNAVNGMKTQAEGLSPEVPENLFEICQKQELIEQDKEVIAKIGALSLTRKNILL